MSEFYPFAPRESQLEEYREDARRSFSRIGWACFAMMLVMQGGAALLMLGCQLLAMRGSRFMIAFIQSEWFQWVITDAANYGLGLPVLLLILRPMPLPPAPPRRRVTAKQFGALALISYAVVYLTNLIGLGINAAISALRGQQAGEPLQDMVTGTNPWIIFLFGVLLAPVVEEWIFRKLILRRPPGESRWRSSARRSCSGCSTATLGSFSMPSRWGRSLPMWRCAPGASAIRWRCTSW